MRLSREKDSHTIASQCGRVIEEKRWVKYAVSKTATEKMNTSEIVRRDTKGDS